jgi:HD-GYP domain-containing protein (c-di-GMP phosphodiesterase class II)
VVVIAASVPGSDAFARQFDDGPSRTAVVVIEDVRAARRARAIEARQAATHISIESPVSADDLTHAVRCAMTWRAEVAVLEDHARQELAAAVQRRQRTLRQVVMTSRTATTAHEQLLRTFDAPPPVFSHARRVAGLAGEMARSLNLSGEACAEIEGAALLHDIGKLALPEAVLSGEAPIGDPEMEALLDSPARTLQLLEAMPSLAAVSWLIRRSREWWDGSGGPEGLRGWDIPIGARILAVADAIETEQDCEGRPVRETATLSAAIARRAGTRFDPDVVRVGLRAVESRSCC